MAKLELAWVLDGRGPQNRLDGNHRGNQEGGEAGKAPFVVPNSVAEGAEMSRIREIARLAATDLLMGEADDIIGFCREASC